LLHAADAITVVTESFKRRVVEKGVPPERIHVIPNGVDTAAYYRSAEPAPLPDLQRRHEGEFVVGYLGNFGAGQALEVVVDAAELLAAEDPDIRMVIAGDGPERQRVQDRVQQKQLPNLSIHDAIPKSQTRSFYTNCDAFLVPLTPIPVFQETIPSKIFEVMACETPVIASLGGEGKRIVDGSGCGISTPPGNPRAIADAIKRMKTTPPGDRRTMGARGREYVTQHYHRDALAARYLTLLRDVAAAGRR
jgi:glycosyltransferase involved in cell wall biosynthesis